MAYDANGNMTSRNGDTINWTSFNYPSSIEDGSKTYAYSYDANRQRWKQVFNDGVNTETTYYVTDLFEKEVTTADTAYRHYIYARGGVVAVHVRQDTGPDFDRYFLRDHLGSVSSITDQSGASMVYESFSAFGEHRDAVDWTGPPSSAAKAVHHLYTDRGYTDHLMLEDSSLIHMRGRVMDARIGRFLSPDPYVPQPGNSQSFNRYSYVMNNPLRYTDPTGFRDCDEILDPNGCKKRGNLGNFGGCAQVSGSVSFCWGVDGPGYISSAYPNSSGPPYRFERKAAAKRRGGTPRGADEISLDDPLLMQSPGTQADSTSFASDVFASPQAEFSQPDSSGGATYFASVGVGGIISNYFGEISIGGGVSVDDQFVPDLGLIITTGSPVEDMHLQFDLGIDGSVGMARRSLTGLEGEAIATNLSVIVPGASAPLGGLAAGGSRIADLNGDEIAIQATLSVRGGPIGASQTQTSTTVFSVRRGIQNARSALTDSICSFTGNC